ncbi:GNAT family N-acetyltransferase [Pseudarthrobacter sp. AL07]|uniref:GNAT family N-acetyltransferase n=1 Tax=unclassified Pseudarthrobacter TaxID=2647000 RepID=UPI00249B56A0|nr:MULTISPECIES: GNAT family N-acetyltransferase [unclassified Pseudarthrobacter]MDI3195411.1 GNAT family N-acetyltransferase [Pseudarthrobacter sp. AL20]MDI3209477.1 GNAT family N-acetyltransferase [Pseudarthrobacter sp. AL07]
MKIRIATHHDAPQLAELLKHWHRHEFESKRYANRQGPYGPGTHVAERDGTIVGWLTGSHANENANEMEDYADRPNRRCSVLLAMYVDVAHQDDGIGTDLVETFLQESEEAGNTMAYVHPDATADQEQLWRFYERLGFTLRRPANRRISRQNWPMARDSAG